MNKDAFNSRYSGLQIFLPKERIAEFCRRNHIKKLAIFGSVLRSDFGADSDIDVLVEFDPDHVPGLAFFAMEEELSKILRRKVDLNTPHCLSRYFRDKVLQEAEVQYVEG
jgi:predicted nucleotidyltransferase